jgi:hypothetical protein
MNDRMLDDKEPVELSDHKVLIVIIAVSIFMTNILMVSILAIPAYIQGHNDYIMSWKMSRVTSGDVTISDDMKLVNTAIVNDGSFFHPHKTVTITIRTPHKDSNAKDWCVDSGVDMSCHQASSIRTQGNHSILVFSNLPLKWNHTMLSGLFYKDNKTTAVSMNDDWPAR